MLARYRFALACALLLAAPSLSHARLKYKTDSGKTIDVAPQVLVKYKNGQKGRLARIRNIRGLNVDVVNVPKGQSVESLVEQLNRDPNVEYAEPNGVLRKLATANDFFFASQYWLTKIQAPSAWDITQGSSTVIVAVIDTGIDLTHTDLKNKLWASTGTRIEIDWNGDGDCTDQQVCTPYTDGDDQCASNDPSDDNVDEYHGTRVSGIIAAQTNNSFGIAGVAPNVRIMVIKGLNSCGSGTYEGIAEAILYAVAHGAKVINMSLGGPSGSRAVSDAIDQAVAQNIIVVAASGNDGTDQPVNFPAALPKVIAVGATDSTNALASFSCTGPTLDLVAPGVEIFSTIATNTISAVTNCNDDGNCGTSFSAPMVSGVAALLKSLDPNMTVDDATRYIDFSATDLGAPGFDNGYGFGLLNASAALSYAASGSLPTPIASPSKTYPIPNPFRPLSDGTAELVLPTNLQSASSKEIRIFTIAGERVRTLTNTLFWDGKNDDGNVVASGLYHYYVDTSLGTAKGKVTVLK